MMTVSFKILFKIKFLHYFLLNKGLKHFEGMSNDDKLAQLNRYNIHDTLIIEPTDTCRQKLKGLKLIYKKVPAGIIIATPVDLNDDSKPFSDFVEKDVFTFEVGIKDGRLLNFSSLPLRLPSGYIYYFTNHDKPDISFPDLTRLADEFDPVMAGEFASDGNPETFAYHPGDLLIDDTSDPSILFEAMKSTNQNTATIADWREDLPADNYDNSHSYNEGDVVSFEIAGKKALYRALADTKGNDPSDTSNWEKEIDLPLYYINRADSLKTSGPLYEYEFLVSGLNAHFELLDANGNVILTDDAESSVEVMSYTLDLRTLPQGLYTLVVVNSDTMAEIEQVAFYLLPQQKPGRLFGIIDIYSGDDEGDFSLVQADNSMNSPEFSLRVKNRSTVWRYINSRDREIEHESGFNPLTQSGNVEVLVSGKEYPNPSADIIKPAPEQYYSEIYL